MGIWDTLLGRNTEEVSSQSVFGRYSDSQKSDAKYDRWDQALKAYEDGLYLENFSHLLEFLKDDELNNLTYTEDRGVITFQFYQGSKLIKGTADRNKLKHDDILLAEYESLSKVGDHHISKVPQETKDIKYRFIRTRIQSLLDLIDSGKINIQKYPAGLCYLIIDLAYKIDYLVKPEGYTLDLVEEIHQTYFQSKSQDIHAKNQKIIQRLKTWMDRPRANFDDEIYEVISTFGITMPSGHDKLAECIESELPNMDWYYDNKYDDVALAIPSYLVGYLMFSYALPDPDRDFLHLLYEIIETDYFTEMGFSNKYWKKGALNASVIKKQISKIGASRETVSRSIILG